MALCCTGAGAGPLSTHERRMARMAERVRALEAENMGDKDWFMRGETSAGVLACRQRLLRNTIYMLTAVRRTQLERVLKSPSRVHESC